MEDHLMSFVGYYFSSWNNLYFILLLLSSCIVILLRHHFKARKALKELVVNKHILSTIHTHLQGIIFRSDFSGKRNLKYISENILTYTGYTAQSLINSKELSFHDIIHPADRANLLASIHEIARYGKNYQVEYRIRTKWGADKWIMEQGIGILNKKGELIAVEGILSDITDSKAAVEFLKESEQRFQILIERAPLGIWISYNDMITYCNPACLKMLKVTNLQEIVGSSVLEFIVPKKRQQIEKLIQRYNLGLPPVSGHETIGLRKDGSEFPLQIFLTTVDLGDFKATVTFLIDIAERKQAEENLISLNQRLNDIIELIPDPTFVLDKNKNVIHWNKATEELTGVKKEEVLGKNDYAHSIPFYGIKRPMLIDLVDVEDGQLEKDYSYVKRIKDKVYGEFSGSILFRNNVHLWGVAAPLFDSNGNRFGAIEVIKDISESKKREEALAESEKKARIVLDSNKDIILLIKPNGSILDCNTRFLQRLGKPREELLGSNYLSFLSDSLKVNREEVLRMVAETGEILVTEDISPDGAEYYTTTIYPARNEHGEIKSLVVYSQDTTRLKLAEKALKDSEEQYRTITESISDFVYKVTFEKGKAKLTYINPNSEIILGYTPLDFKSDPNLLHNLVVEEDKQLVNTLINRMLIKRKNTTIEHRIIHKSGKTMWISNSLIFSKEKNKKVFEYNGVINDITLRKHFELTLEEAEERYRSVFDQSGLASSVYDLSGKLIMQNSLASSLFGKTTTDLLGRSVEEILPPETARNTRIKISDTLKNGTTTDEREVAFPTGKYWLKTTSHTVRDSMGKIIGVQFISQDVSEKKELDRMVLNTIIDIEEKERMKFAQELHDGLGPLISAIKMYIQWLSRPDAKITQGEILSDIERLINEASETIREISFKLSPHILNNFGLIEAIKTFAEKVQLAKNIDIEIAGNLAERIDITTETVLYRILCEFINNTVKHANATKIMIRIKRVEKKLRISYFDNGIGFDFENALVKKTGTGLFNMKSRLESINGSWIFNKQPENGTKIIITVRI